MQRVSLYDSSDTTGKFNKKVKKLTDALQETKGTDSVFCALYPAGGGTEDSKTQKHSENGKYAMAMNFIQTPTEDSEPFFEGYLAEPGVDPVDSKGEVNASKVSFSGFGVVSIALLEMRQLKDETKGDKDFKVRRAKLRALARSAPTPLPGHALLPAESCVLRRAHVLPAPRADLLLIVDVEQTETVRLRRTWLCARRDHRSGGGFSVHLVHRSEGHHPQQDFR